MRWTDVLMCSGRKRWQADLLRTPPHKLNTYYRVNVFNTQVPDTYPLGKCYPCVLSRDNLTIHPRPDVESLESPYSHACVLFSNAPFDNCESNNERICKNCRKKRFLGTALVSYRTNSRRKRTTITRSKPLQEIKQAASTGTCAAHTIGNVVPGKSKVLFGRCISTRE